MDQNMLPQRQHSIHGIDVAANNHDQYARGDSKEVFLQLSEGGFFILPITEGCFFLQLSFRKGDVITVTQQLEGGWWEGTLHSNTGWFPCDYVVVIPPSGKHFVFPLHLFIDQLHAAVYLDTIVRGKRQKTVF